MSSTSHASALASSELFAALAPDEIDRLLPEIEAVRLPGGSVLFQQGDGADCLYIVVSGRLRVSIDRPDGTEQVLGEVGRGDAVGEMALLIGDHRSATARAVRDTELLRLGKDAFNRLVERHPAMTMAITRRLVARYQAAIKGAAGGTRGTVAAIALVATSRDVPLSEFSQRLERALAEAGPVLRLTSDRVSAALGGDAAQTPQDHARNGELAAWLMEQEGQHRTVVYEADLARSAWTSRCLRQADRILLVGADDVAPELGAIEVATQREGRDNTAVRRELVLLHRARQPLYPGTREWLAARRVDRHHHVVLGEAADYARLVRRLTGTATGVVLGGGGARCFAEIGVLKAMTEAGVPIDMIGGTSMGAYLAAQHALGWDAARMLQFNRDLWVRDKPLKEYTLPYIGLVGHSRFLRATRGVYGEAHVEDLGIPFFCCSSNITKARVVVHDRGPLWRALSASIAVPGISAPLFEGGDLLVDGAVLDNLPIGVMRARCDGRVLAVDVSPVEDVRTDPTYTLCPPSWQILANRLNPLARQKLQVPTLFEVLSRCASLSSVQQVEALKEQADLYLHPPVEPFSMFDWHRLDEMADVGYKYARVMLRDWDGGSRRGAHGSLPLRVTTTIDVA